ncbi:MAG: hypothetical protein SFZ03_00380 [Candidatus Melainabacteria bacterium]|nr:hypothetical protein [Candidatus Melainabacteria bacterium]
MSFGRKKNDSPPPVQAPPAITRVEFNAPIGDRFISEVVGSTQTAKAELSPFTQALVDQSADAALEALSGLIQPDATRSAQIQQRADDYFQDLSRTINDSADDAIRRTQSGLARRFGGSANATFGNDLIDRLERSRQQELAGARRNANLLGEELSQNDETSRVRRLSTFLNLVNAPFEQSYSLFVPSSDTLLQERQRETDLARFRASLAAQYDQNLNRSQIARGNAIGGVANGLFSLFG